MILEEPDLYQDVKEFSLVLDFLLDDSDLLRLANSRPKYLYTTQTQSLYLKHINHLDFSSPYLAISYGKEHHEIINLETNSHQKFFINHENLDEFFSVAMGVTEHLAMIAIGDSFHTRIQIVNANHSLKVLLNTTYMEDENSLFPVPRYFLTKDLKTELVYSDGSKLPIDLTTFGIAQRSNSQVTSIVKSHELRDPVLSIVGPFILLTFNDQMKTSQLLRYKLLIEKGLKSEWIAINPSTVVHVAEAQRATHDFDELIVSRKKQLLKLEQLLQKSSS